MKWTTMLLTAALLVGAYFFGYERGLNMNKIVNERLYIMMDSLVRIYHHTGMHTEFVDLCPECNKLIDDSKKVGISDEELIRLGTIDKIKNRVMFERKRLKEVEAESLKK